jgi:hypothetical protein
MGKKMKAAEVAELIGVTEVTFRSYVSKKFAPAASGRDPKTGVLVWDRDEIQAWSESRPGRGRWKESRSESQPRSQPKSARRTRKA